MKIKKILLKNLKNKKSLLNFGELSKLGNLGEFFRNLRLYLGFIFT